MKGLFVLLPLVALVSCGGGGGGGSTASAPIVVTPGTMTTNVTVGTSAPIRVLATATRVISGQITVTVTEPNEVFLPNVDMVQADAQGMSYYVTLHTSPGLVAEANLTGNLSVTLLANGVPVAGCPVAVPYDLHVNSLAPVTAVPGLADWGTFQGNAAHTGFMPVTLDATKFDQRWSWTAPAYDLTGITTAGGMIFLGSNQQVYALNESDSSQAWQSGSYASLGSIGPMNPPAVSGGQVFVVAGAQSYTYLFGMNASTGVQTFQTQLGYELQNDLAPTVSGNTVYTDCGGVLYALSTVDGSQTYYTGAGSYDWTPAVSGSEVYTYTASEGLQIIGAGSGTIQYQVPDTNLHSYTGFMYSAPVLSAVGSVFCVDAGSAGNSGGVDTNGLSCFDTASHTLRWSIPGRYSGNPAYNAGVVYAVNNEPFQLEARSETTGALQWSWALTDSSESGFAGDVLLTNNLVFVTTNTQVHAIDLVTHATVWTYPAPGKVIMSANGILYLGVPNQNGVNGQVIAIDTNPGA